MTRTLTIFAKPPLIGVSKTRLAQSLGPAEARRISRWTTARTLREAVDPRWYTVLYAAPDTAMFNTYGSLWPLDVPRRSQGTGDLGDRLAKAFDEAELGAVLFVGVD
ncbi:MAG: hypothetical protein AAFS13_05245, partial [Pseudomonadota bacterium]